MKTLDFINQAIGELVYITGDGDLCMTSFYRPYVYNKTPLRLIKLTKSGNAYLQDESKNKLFFSVSPRNVREYKELENED